MAYKFCENRIIRIEVPFDVGIFENEFLQLAGNYIVIHGDHLKGYAWDGCTPKFSIFDLYFGTPDGVIEKVFDEQIYTLSDGDPSPLVLSEYREKTYFASLVHDILYQFKAEVPVSRKKADEIFLHLLEKRDFKLAGIYFFMVRTFGRFFGEWKTE